MTDKKKKSSALYQYGFLPAVAIVIQRLMDELMMPLAWL